MTRRTAVILAALLAVGSVADAQSAELRLGVLGQSGVRNTMVLDEPRSATGLLAGADLFARYRFIGLRARVQGGELTESGDGPLATAGQADVIVLLGVPLFSAEVGVARRALAGPFATTSFDVAHLGASSQIAIGSSGFTVRLAGGVLSPLGEPHEATGLAMESNLFWFPAGKPIYAVLGYRHEQFRVATGSEHRDEELGSIMIGGGFRLLRRRAP